MPLPAPLVGLTVRAKVITADSAPVVGATVTLTPTVPARSPSGDVLLAPIALSEVTGVDGAVEWTNVLATDSPGLSNRVPYKVTITNSAGHLLEHPYPVELLSSLAVDGVLRLDDVAPALTTPAKTTYVLAASVGAVGGPAGPLDAAGKVPAAQLPAAGGSIPSTIVDAPGDIVAASAADTPARHPAGGNGHMLLADSSQSTGLRWSARTTPTYDPAMDGLVAVAADPLSFHGQSVLGASGWAVRMKVPAGAVITGALACVTQAGTLGAGGANGFAINDDTGTLVTSTVDDNNLWTTTGVRSKAFVSPVAAQTDDRYLYVSMRVTGYTVNPYFIFADGVSNGARLAGLMSTKCRSLSLSGSTWSAFDPTIGGGGGFMVLLALY